MGIYMAGLILGVILFYRTALDLLHCKCIESYSAMWGHIALFISHCMCLHMFYK